MKDPSGAGPGTVANVLQDPSKERGHARPWADTSDTVEIDTNKLQLQLETHATWQARRIPNVVKTCFTRCGFVWIAWFLNVEFQFTKPACDAIAPKRNPDERSAEFQPGDTKTAPLEVPEAFCAHALMAIANAINFTMGPLLLVLVLFCAT